MTSFRQIEANRRNAAKSTGPQTPEGKQRSRCNAIRHGLTAESVIGALEDAEDYKAFEAKITYDYDAQSAVERELVLRLASLLWRLRRAATIETGLFDIQVDRLSDPKERKNAPASRQIVYAPSGQASDHLSKPPPAAAIERETTAVLKINPSVELAGRFLQLTNLPNFALDRLSRYESSLWRQVAQTLFALEALERRKPQEHSRRFRSSEIR